MNAVLLSDGRCLSLQRRIINITFRTRRVIRGGIGLIERCIDRKAARQVGIGDELHSKRDGIGFASREHPVARLLGEALVGNVVAAKRDFQLRAEPVVAEGLAVQMNAMRRWPSSRAT